MSAENDFLGMPDEEFAKLNIYSISEEETNSAEAEDGLPEGDSPEEETSDAEGTEETEANEDSEETTEADAESSEEVEEALETEETKDTSENSEQETVEAADSTAIDFETEYKKLLAPFRANGKEMQVDNVEDAIQLMQMGAGFNKKMAALKPNLKLLKLLENNGLLDEQKLSYLIDLDKKKPEAITRLLKDSNIDPLDIDVNKESDYTPSTYTVDDAELALDEVLSQIQDTPTFTKTIDAIKNNWDGQSKQYVANNPQLLSVINNHMASGIYDLIYKEIEKERVFGRLNGLSDLEAYRQVGDRIHANGGFEHLFSQKEQAQSQARKGTPATAAKDPQLKQQKRAASSSKSSKPKSTPADFNPLAMSDDEFEKMGLSKFL